MNPQFLSRVIIRILLLLPFFATDCAIHASPSSVVEASEEPVPISTYRNEYGFDVGIDLSRALANGKLTLLFFTPVEMCMIRYCLQPALVEAQLAQLYPNRMNMVVAPVYAVDTPDKPPFPVVDLGVYLVEPYASWMPELVPTQFGWGIDAPSVALVHPDGGVLYRGGEFFDVEELASYME